MGIKRGSKAQIDLSFGFIFSVILIAIFLIVAFIAIRTFLEINRSVTTANFIRELNQEVERIWAGAGEEYIFKSRVSDNPKLEEVCFFNKNTVQRGEFKEEYEDFTGSIIGDHNLYFFPQKETDAPSFKIEHINMSAFNKNPYCIPIINKEAKILIHKKFNEVLVEISEA